MALVLRIVSTDGKKVFSRVLPALPAHIKIPPGAKIEVIDQDTKQKYSLPQYINTHVDKADSADAGPPKVTVERVASWDEAQAWLDSVGTAVDTETGYGPWYDQPDAHREGEIVGMKKDTLLIGGLVGAGLVGGAYLATRSGGTKDTVAPVAPSGLDLAADDDTGSSNTDNITSKTSELTITGTAEAGSKVELRDGTTIIGTADATASGTFSFDVSLTEGLHLILATATDRAGNVSGPSTILQVRVDTTPPTALGTLTIDSEDDTGISDTDGITSRTTGLTVNGTAEASARVEILDGTTVIATKVADANGNWNADLALTLGAHELSARVTDTAGNVANSPNKLNVVIDAVAPLAPSQPDLATEDDNGASNTDNITSKTQNLTISGTAEAGSTVELFNGGVSLGTVLVDSTGHYAKDFNFSPNEYLIKAQATDVAGNVSPLSVALELSVVASDTAAGITVETHTFG